jgi:putative endonuclease
MDDRQRLGALGEGLAGEHLEARGYAILDRNFRTRYGELDLVAADSSCLVFCEVKTRVGRTAEDPFGPLTAVGVRKRAQLRRMAREWLAGARWRGRRPAQLRFDAIGVTLRADGRLLVLDHLEDAF